MATTPRRRRRAILTLLPAAATLAALVPEALRLDRHTPAPMLVPYRARLAGALALTTAAATAVTELVREPGRRRSTPLLATAAVGLAAGAVSVGAVASGRRTTRRLRPAPAHAGPTRPEGTTTRELTVLTANVRHGQAEVCELAALITTERPDIVVLPEAGDLFCRRLAAQLETGRSGRGGYATYSVGPGRSADGPADATGEPDGACTSVLVGRRLGAVEVHPVRADTVRGWVQVTGGGLGNARVLGVHTVAPMPATASTWAREVAALGEWFDTDRPTILAGDLNATIDHEVLRRALRRARSSGATRHAPAVPTWPANLPPWAGAVIDHVLVSPSIAVADHRVLEVPGSDHRAVLATVVLPRPRRDRLHARVVVPADPRTPLSGTLVTARAGG